MSDQRNKIEEHALDALLVEVLGNAQPPDLSDRILTQFASSEQDDAEVRSIVSTSSSRLVSVPSGSPSKRRMVWAVAVVATVAASYVLVVWRRGDDQAENLSTVATREPTNALTPDLMKLGSDIVPAQDSSDGSPIRPRGIPLVIDHQSDQPQVTVPVDGVTPPPATKPLANVTLVSKEVDSELQGYWNTIGIQPATEADADEVVQRLASVLGVKLPGEVLADPQRLQSQFARHEVAREVATRWLQQITDRGLQRLDQQSRDLLVDDLAACLQSERPFDQTVVDWINGTSPLSSSFYSAISHAGNDAMARRLAALTMNVDLRCVRCHDSKIEGSGRRQDYWGFAALLSHGVSRDAKGQVTIDPVPTKSKPIFYELADGRQRLAEPTVPKSWLTGSTVKPTETVTDWAAELVGSEAMARGAVNSLWHLVHGQPLRGRVVDPITAPHNDELDRIEEHLVQDLMASQFDVSRTLALIIASPSTRRSVPTPLLPENALVVSEEDTRGAIDAVNAFAAALPQHAGLPMKQRLDQTMRAIGGMLDQNGQPFVAQIDVGSEQRSATGTGPSSKSFAADFPIRGESLPVQWLTLVEDDQSQVDHLGYLAGMKQLPESVRAAVEAMQDNAQVSKELMLNRVWWLVQP